MVNSHVRKYEWQLKWHQQYVKINIYNTGPIYGFEEEGFGIVIHILQANYM